MIRSIELFRKSCGGVAFAAFFWVETKIFVDGIRCGRIMPLAHDVAISSWETLRASGGHGYVIDLTAQAHILC